MKKIKFTYLSEYSYNVHDRPKPSKSLIPDWFKKMPAYTPSIEDPEGKKIIIQDSQSNATAKKCTPMLDAITTGYTVCLWSDVQVKQTANGPLITWRVKEDVFSLHGNYSSPLIPTPPGYDNVVFKYLTDFWIETPKGYSVMVRPPAGHYDLPFHAIPAIIDSDDQSIDNNFPVWIRSGLEGIIEKGTPIAQIIPFKRDDWKAEFSFMPREKYVWNVEKTFKSSLVNHYVRNIWKKKNFE